jgi:hypothetical protein
MALQLWKITSGLLTGARSGRGGGLGAAAGGVDVVLGNRPRRRRPPQPATRPPQPEGTSPIRTSGHRQRGSPVLAVPRIEDLIARVSTTYNISQVRLDQLVRNISVSYGGHVAVNHNKSFFGRHEHRFAGNWIRVGVVDSLPASGGAPRPPPPINTQNIFQEGEEGGKWRKKRSRVVAKF